MEIVWDLIVWMIIVINICQKTLCRSKPACQHIRIFGSIHVWPLPLHDSRRSFIKRHSPFHLFLFDLSIPLSFQEAFVEIQIPVITFLSHVAWIIHVLQLQSIGRLVTDSISAYQLDPLDSETHSASQRNSTANHRRLSSTSSVSTPPSVSVEKYTADFAANNRVPIFWTWWKF